jgi:hypothetical protein
MLEEKDEEIIELMQDYNRVHEGTAGPLTLQLGND